MTFGLPQKLGFSTRTCWINNLLGQDDNTPYVFIAYTTAQFHISSRPRDLTILLGLAFTATHIYRDSIKDPHQKPGAFWIAHSCTPHDKYVDSNGVERIIDMKTPEGKLEQELLVNSDVNLAILLFP